MSFINHIQERKVLSKLLDFSQRNHIVDVFSVMLSLCIITIGISLLVMPDAYSTPTFHLVMQYISPGGWGVGMLTAGGLSLWSMLFDTRTAYMSMFLQAFTWSVWDLFLMFGAFGGGVPSAAVVYLTLCLMSTVLGVLYWKESTEGVRHG